MALTLAHSERIAGNISKEFNKFGQGFIMLANVIANSGEIDGREYCCSRLAICDLLSCRNFATGLALDYAPFFALPAFSLFFCIV
jgi:hypothetical protein